MNNRTHLAAAVACPKSPCAAFPGIPSVFTVNRELSLSARLPPDTPVFHVPSRLVKILDRDLRLAGIAKRDERDRTLDVHALRTTFRTLLSKGGVAPRTAQAAMRHSDIRLTMGVYTDPKLLDVRGALDALPLLSLQCEGNESEMVRATGTSGAARMVAPTVAPTPDNRGQERSN